MTAPQLTVRLLGMLAAVSATRPTAGPLHLGLAVVAALVGWFAAAPVVARPVSRDFRWRGLLRRHRATAFGTLVLLLCAVAGRPDAWAAGADVLLFLAWLLAAEALAGGPPARRLLRSGAAVATVTGGAVAVLGAALLPVTPAPTWGRLLAACAALAVALGLTVLWLLRHREQPR